MAWHQYSYVMYRQYFLLKVIFRAFLEMELKRAFI